MSFVFANRKWGTDALGTSGGNITWSMNLAGLLFSTSGANSFALSDFQNQVRRAFDTWAVIANLNFIEQSSGGDIDLFVTDDSRTQKQIADNEMNLFGDPGGTVAIARSFFGLTNPDPYNDISIMDTGRVLFDAAETWSPTGQVAETLDFYAVAIHEIGHLLGLLHVEDDTEIMNPVIFASLLGDGDIEGIQTIYGVRQWTDGPDMIDLSDIVVGQEVFAFAGADTIIGGPGADRLFGGAGGDNVSGNSGNDTIIDALGLNTLNGGGDNDLIIGGGDTTVADGGDGHDIIIGGAADDILSGGRGDDTIRGDIAASFFFGDDRLIGGAGNDFLEGSGGADTFVFRPNEGRNEIGQLTIDPANPGATEAVAADFVSGVDKIALNGFNYSDASDALDDLAAVAQGVQFQHQQTTILFVGLELTDLGASDFILNDWGIA